MKIPVYLALLVSGPAALCFAASHADRWTVREQETIQKTLTLSGPPMRLIVDNVDGYVHVTGTNGSQVRVTAQKVIRAETDSYLQEAKSEVHLEMTEKPGVVTIYYDAPWRCNGESGGCHADHRHFYEVSYDIDVQVPRNARTVVSTVNGEIKVNGTSGGFDVSDVNGSISMAAIVGSGDVHTVNGPIAVHFARNPANATSFKSINGQLDVYFQPDFSADLLFKTFNGQIYSDFEVAPRAASAAADVERNDGKFIYRSSRARAAQVGAGGPELSFDAFNGNIRLHREQ
jgi:hypothetical protein